MSLIDSTYFTLDCNIPLGTYNTLTESIARYERDILLQLLGNDLYKLVAAYSVNSPQRIKDIVEGKEYTVGNYTVRWNGLKNDQKVSIISYYVFIQLASDKQVTLQNVGAVVDPNATSIAGLIQKNGGRLRQLAGYAGQDGWAPSLWNFLMANIAVYTEWFCNEYNPPNAFDI